MTQPFDRRQFMQAAAATSFVLGALDAQADDTAAPVPKSANDKIVMGVMGVNGRGSALAKGFVSTQPNCEIAYICDVDERAIARLTPEIAGIQKRTPQGVADFRRILDDPTVDVLVVAAPNHWHAPASILASAAKKHVYVEKPCCHNPQEGEWMVAAARKHDRVVQMGNQRRSRAFIVEAIEKVHSGAIGRAMYSHSWYTGKRPSIGHGKPADVPKWLDYALWQGPAPERPFVDNLLHYNWHWRWHWGNGELGNNGIHGLDLCRWGLGVDYPTTVTSGGGKHRHDDDQETPDTHMVTYDFSGKTITWEGLSWSPFNKNGSGFGVTFHGDQGTMVLTDAGYKILDMQNKEVASRPGESPDAPHFANFLECIRTGQRPNSDIEEGYKSTLLCHLGNIAHRTGHTLHTRAENGHIENDPEAMALWGREYQSGWEPKV